MKKIKLIVNSKSKKYPIIIGLNTLNKISNILRSNKIIFAKCLIVYDKNVPKKKLNQSSLFIILIQVRKIKILKI